MLARPRPDPARARHVLVIAAIVIVAGQLAAGIALDGARAYVRFPQAAKVLEQARRRGDDPFVLLLGSSRFWQIDVGTVTAALRETMGPAHPAVVKGAVLAGDAIVAAYLLKELLHQGSRPGLIALEISPETLARPAPWIADHAIRFFTWRDVAAWAPEILAGDRTSRVVAARFAPIHTYRRELLTWIVGTTPPYLKVPSPAATPLSTERRPTAREKIVTDFAAAPPPRPRPSGATLFGLRQTRKWLRHYRLDGGEAGSLEQLLARCHAQGIRVALVGVPVTSWVRGLYTPEIESAFATYLERVSGRYGAEFVDYRGRVVDGFFKDHHHLNLRGGAFFARMLGAEVLAPRWSVAKVPRRTGSIPLDAQ